MEKTNFKSILVITVGFIVLGFITHADWPFYVAGSIGLLSISSDRAAGLINKIWFGLAKVLGYINSRILLTIVYYLFLFPLAIISRLFGKRSITLKRHDHTYYAVRDHQYEKADLENPW